MSNDRDDNLEFNRESRDKKSDFEENNDDNDEQEHLDTEVLTDNFGITTDEILKMYENVELDLDEADKISAEEIVKMYENENDNYYAVKMSTRKLKKKTI